MVAVAAAAAVALATGLGWWWLDSVNTDLPTLRPLALADGSPLETVEVATDAPHRRLALTDGSSIELGPDTHLVPVVNNGREMTLRLLRGEAELDVRHGRDRTWTVEVGLA